MTARLREFPLFLLVAAMSLLMLGAGRAAAQKIDLNANGMSDIWEQIYGATGLDPTADTDGDGVPNGLEALAGTDPLDASSAPRISGTTLSGTNFSVSMPCALGKQYQLQSVEPLGPGGWTNWTPEARLVVRSGTVVTLDGAIGPWAKFFRIAVSDVDTDGDGVNDWEEYQLGLDPLNPLSNGQLDNSGQPMNDYAYVTGKLASQNIVTISATDPVATQPDPGQNPINVGELAITRGGFPLRAITVGMTIAGPGAGYATEAVDFAAVPHSIVFPVGVSYQTIAIAPLANTNLMSPVNATIKLASGSGYNIGINSNANVVIYPSSTPSGSGLTGQYYTNASSTYSSGVNFNPANLKLTRVENTNIDFTWGTTSTPIPNSGYYCVRWTGQIMPQYSETYYFVANTDDGVKLWVNDQLIIDSWISKSASDITGTIALQGGVRYNIKMEYFQLSGSAAAHLSWYSASQSKLAVPMARLFATTNAPTAVTSPLTAVGFLGQPFSYTVTGANSPTRYTASPLPPGLSFNPTNGVLSGTPNLAGEFQISVTASNANGVGASVVDLQVFDTGSSVTREVWLGIAGTNVSDIPLNTPATITNTLGSLESISNYDDNYGERIRGYITAPATANYSFWLAGADSAELWISNDGEPVNKVRRVTVAAGGTASRQWNLLTTQKSPWLALIAGQRYYVEILHKAGVGANDNLAVGWLQDPTGTNTTPSGVVPGYTLSRYFPVPPAYTPGTLYSATMNAEANTSTGVGSATLRLSTDGSKAVLKFSYSGLSSSVTGKHVHSDPYLSNPSQIIFDIDDATPQPDGSYVWNVGPVGSLSAAYVVEIIQEGKAYINVHTVNYPAGEIRGNFTAADGSQTFTPPPPAPAWTDDHGSYDAAARFLIQATFGPSAAEITNVQAMGYDGWLSNQFSLPATHHLPTVLSNVNPDATRPYPGTLTFNTWWRHSVTAPDQLRQRVAFALSEITVVSQQGILQDNARALSSYYDTFLDNAFGNFRGLLRAVTLHPAMGLYLDMRQNDKGDITVGRHPNENYAREIMQLFSIGLNRLWPDGTLVLDSTDNLVPTYDQNVILGMAAVFTGWNYYQANQGNGHLPSNFSPAKNYTNPMVLVPTHHELGTKRLLDNVVLAQAWGLQTNTTTTNFDGYCSQDLELAMDSIFYNQNVGPFICRQLIQRLVTSNPSRDYLYRVVQVFNDDGTGVRGNLQAVIRAILLDYEARSTTLLSQPAYGKQREPVLRVTATARAFPPPAPLSATYVQNGFRPITNTTASLHRLNDGDTILMTFTDTSGQAAPPAQGYSVTVLSPTSFRVNAPGLSTGTYTLTPNATVSNMVTTATDTTNIITVTISGHGLNPGNPVYLVFTAGGAANGVYQVISTTNTGSFVVETADSTARPTNSCLIPKWTGGSFTQSSTDVTVSLTAAHGLNPGDNVYINFPAGYTADNQYTVATVPDATHFTIVAPAAVNTTQNGQTVFPLVAPPLVRSGNSSVQWSTYSLNTTDTGSSSSLSQTPLNAATVFNFFFPDYKFQGALAAAGLTTPEFQLTSDTSVMLQMNFLEGGLLNNTGNTNGLSSFTGGDGDLIVDLGSYLTAGYTANAGLPSLVDALNSLLVAGQLSASAKTLIVNYVANTSNFGYSTPPTYTQMRDRVRAVVHLIINSPDFTIQK